MRRSERYKYIPECLERFASCVRIYRHRRTEMLRCFTSSLLVVLDNCPGLPRVPRMCISASVAYQLPFSDEKRIQHICWSLAALVDPLVSCSSMLGFNLSVAHLCLE